MIKKPVVPNPENVQLAEGVLVANFNPDNWDDQKTIPFGASRGGGNINVQPTNRPVRFDGDRGEHTKGLKRRTEWVVLATFNALELQLENMSKFMPGTTTDHPAGQGAPSYKKFRPNVNFKLSDYIDNIAYITETMDGKVVAYVIENVLGDEALQAAFADKDEIVPEITFHAHFDPEKLDEVPFFIVYYDAEEEPEEE